MSYIIKVKVCLETFTNNIGYNLVKLFNALYSSTKYDASVVYCFLYIKTGE